MTSDGEGKGMDKREPGATETNEKGSRKKNLRGKAGSEFAVLQSGITQRSEHFSLG